LQAAKDFGIDLKKSFIVGDKTTDIEAGKRAGVKSILVLTGYQGKDGRSQTKPDIVCKGLVEVAEAIP
jgi:phosphoglycolate phosphatase-like HAD superfamily hydrolase